MASQHEPPFKGHLQGSSNPFFSFPKEEITAEYAGKDGNGKNMYTAQVGPNLLAINGIGEVIGFCGQQGETGCTSDETKKKISPDPYRGRVELPGTFVVSPVVAEYSGRDVDNQCVYRYERYMVNSKGIIIGSYF
jgi:hypothetical protein